MKNNRLYQSIFVNFYSSTEWNTLSQKDKDKIGVKVENDGEFWSVSFYFATALN